MDPVQILIRLLTQGTSSYPSMDKPPEMSPQQGVEQGFSALLSPPPNTVAAK